LVAVTASKLAVVGGGVGRPASFRLADDGTASPLLAAPPRPAHGARNAADERFATGC
jgi:hypothetical protein